MAGEDFSVLESHPNTKVATKSYFSVYLQCCMHGKKSRSHRKCYKEERPPRAFYMCRGKVALMVKLTHSGQFRQKIIGLVLVTSLAQGLIGFNSGFGYAVILGRLLLNIGFHSRRMLKIMLLFHFSDSMHSLQNNKLTANNPPTPIPNFPNFPNTTNVHTHGLHISSVVSKVDCKINHVFIHLLLT